MARPRIKLKPREISPRDLLMPPAFADMIDTLRVHIGIVRKAVDRAVTAP